MLEYIKDQFLKDPKDRENWLHEGTGDVVLIAHTCHKHQANDGLSGVAVAKMLSAYPSIACPEGYSQLHIVKRQWKYAIYLDALGGMNKLKCNQTFKGNTKIDRVAKYIFGTLKPFADQGFRNDERRIENVGVPCLAIHRFPFEEYHTKDDVPAKIYKESLLFAFSTVGKLLKIMATDYIPKKGPNWGDAFNKLSKYGLWTDWAINRPMKDLKEAILMRIDEKNSIFDIAEELGEGYWIVRDFIERLKWNDLVQ